MKDVRQRVKLRLLEAKATILKYEQSLDEIDNKISNDSFSRCSLVVLKCGHIEIEFGRR